MYRTITLLVPLALACSTPKYDYDEDSAGAVVNSDADDTTADADEDDGDADADGIDEDDDADGSDDGGNDDDDDDEDEDDGDDDGDDDGPGDPDDCSHPYNPVDKTSWERTYTATFISDNPALGTATATEQGMGEGTSSTGMAVYKTWDTLTTSSGKGWEGSVLHKCDNLDGTKLSIVEWNMELTFDELPASTPAGVLMTLSSPREYLTKTSTIGTDASWGFSYNLSYTDSSGTGVSITIPVNGTYTDMGLKDIDVMGDSMEAWHIQSTYNMDLLGIPDLEGGSSFSYAYDGQADYYWVEDVGLVYEKHVDTRTEAIILEKTLSGSVGLGL
jgi:hypothetical protein